MRRSLTLGALVAVSWLLPLSATAGGRAQATAATQAAVPPMLPSESDRARATEHHKRAVGRLRDAARAAQAEDSTAFSTAVSDAAQNVRALLETATWLPASDREELRATAARLEARAKGGAAGYVPDADLAALDRVGPRVRGNAPVQLLFEGSFARSEPKEPTYGGHATAMAPPPMRPATGEQAPAPPATPEAAAGRTEGGHTAAGYATIAQAAATGAPAPHEIRFDVVPGQLTEKTYGGGLSKLHLVESGGNGVALLDYDGDGLLDIYAVSAFELDERGGRARVPHRSALYRNLGNMRFRSVTADAGVDAAAWGYGVCAGDYDGDGLLDLYVTNYGPNLLYRNTGHGTFEEVAAETGGAASGWSTGCAFLDADGDGDLDLYVARYVIAPETEVASPERFLVWRGVAKVMLGPTGLPGAADLFFENKGGGRFEEATDKWGLTDRTGAYGFAVLATDYDGDGWTDIFVANDSNPNILYRNRGGRGFENVALVAGVATNADGRAQAGMGADSGDFDGDGNLDLVLTTFAFDSNSVYRNTGHGAFEDVSLSAGLVAGTFENMSWGVAFLDADLDGDLDLYFANGHLFPQVDEHPELGESYRQRDQIFLNEGGRFRDVSSTAGRGLTALEASRGVAAGDLDNDGDPDLVVSAMDEEPVLLENTQQTRRHWIGIDLRQDGPNPFAIGARITVTCDGRGQVREVRSGGGYLSQNDLRAVLGLGECGGPVTADVQLGQRQWRFPALTVDKYVSLGLDEDHALAR